MELLWNTFMGGSGEDNGDDLTVDGDGNLYLVGTSNATWGSPLSAYSANLDAFVVKVNPNGTVTWNTFLGGSEVDTGNAIAADAMGDIYVGGAGGTSWGTPVRAYNSPNTDGYVEKLDPDGMPVWNTFLGGNGADYVYGLAVDANGNVYAGGASDATWASPVRAYTALSDAFAAKLSSGGALLWNTFLGGSDQDALNDVRANSSGVVYAAGYSRATWSNGAAPQGCAGCRHALILQPTTDLRQS